KPVKGAVLLNDEKNSHRYSAETSTEGKFAFAGVQPGTYQLSIKAGEREWRSATPVVVETVLSLSLSLNPTGEVVYRTIADSRETKSQASGGEHLSSSEVSSLPLNARDFSKLLLLAAGTMTDTNGAANFTQQFAVSGQRGVTTVFAMDGFDTTDPEMGG